MLHANDAEMSACICRGPHFYSVWVFILQPFKYYSVRKRSKPFSALRGTFLHTSAHTLTEPEGTRQAPDMLWRPTLWVALLGLWAASCYHLTPEDKVAIVEQHNQCRSMVFPTAANMRRMTWDDSLEAVAEKYVARCVWDHNPDRGNVGENLFSTNGPFDPSSAVTSWYMEHQDYSYQNDSCQEDKLCGHYTQVVWADTYSVGCSSHLCANVEGLPHGYVTLLVCNYAPRGNYRGLWPYKEGNPCSQCPSDLQHCENNLCVTDKDVSKTTATSPFPPSDSPTWSAPTDESPDIVKVTNQDNYNWQSSSPSTVTWSPALLLAVLLLLLMP